MTGIEAVKLGDHRESLPARAGLQDIELARISQRLLPLIARRSLAYRMNIRSRGSPWACGIRSTR
jgi:hypothetical protein